MNFVSESGAAVVESNGDGVRMESEEDEGSGSGEVLLPVPVTSTDRSFNSNRHKMVDERNGNMPLSDDSSIESENDKMEVECGRTINKK